MTTTPEHAGVGPAEAGHYVHDDHVHHDVVHHDVVHDVRSVRLPASAEGSPPPPRLWRGLAEVRQKALRTQADGEARRSALRARRRQADLNVTARFRADLVGLSRAFLCVVAALLAFGISVNAATPSLLQAVKNGDAAGIRALLNERVDVTAGETDGTTPLHVAVLRNDGESVDVLLRAGANTKATTRYGVTPLYLACVNGNAAIVEKLLAAGADANTALPEGETPLMTAARTGSVPAIKVLLAHAANVNAKEGWKGQTALMWAAAENNADATKTLIDAGADVEARSRSGAFSAYLFAARAGHIDAARVLLNAGADINEKLPDGTSALLLAILNAHYEAAAFLVDKGADPNADGQGWAPLHQVVWSRRPNTGSNIPGAVPTGRLDSLELVRQLLQHGANVNGRQKKEPKDGFRNMLNRIGATPFLLAAKSVDIPLMRLLLEHGADPKLTTEDGTTALMAAAGVGIWAPGENPGTEEEALAAVKLVYEAGGGLATDVDKNGETALHGAIYRAGSIPVAKFLIEKGAKLDVTNTKGWTPLIVADGVEYTPNVLKRYPETAAFLRQVMAERGLPVPKPLASPPSARGQVVEPEQ
jgi:ankyrin repeat protein